MATAFERVEGQVGNPSKFLSGPAIICYIASSVLLLELLTADRYGYFGDEMSHMACGEHLGWGYVDQPPLIALFLGCVAVIEARNIGQDKAVAALLEHDFLRLRDGDVHRWTGGVSASGASAGVMCPGRKCSAKRA